MSSSGSSSSSSGGGGGGSSSSSSSSSATYDFTELELVQDGGLAGSVKSNHQNSKSISGKETLEEALEGSHLGSEESGEFRLLSLSLHCMALVAHFCVAIAVRGMECDGLKEVPTEPTLVHMSVALVTLRRRNASRGAPAPR